MTEQVQTAPDRTAVLELLRDFAGKPNCDTYKGDSKRILLLSTYIWLRQFTEGLTFELFLEKFSRLADFDETNRKHPDDALKHRCPRSAKQAEKAGTSQWSAKECVDILSLYVDMCRLADSMSVEVPMTLDEYLEMDGPAYKAGEVQPLQPTPLRKSTRQSTSPGAAAMADPVTGLTPTDAKAPPTDKNQRIIYEPPGQNGRQVRGTTTEIKDQQLNEGEVRQYVSFVTDEGEQYNDVAIIHCALVNEPPPAQPADIVEGVKIVIPKSQYAQLATVLALQTPVGNVDIGAVVYTFTAQFKSGLRADINIMNAETRPVVVAELYHPNDDKVLDELPPRENIIGIYQFVTDNGVLQVEVDTRADVASPQAAGAA